jgi:hypothetical protein
MKTGQFWDEMSYINYEKNMVKEIIPLPWAIDIFYWKRHDNILSFELSRNKKPGIRNN